MRNLYWVLPALLVSCQAPDAGVNGESRDESSRARHAGARVPGSGPNMSERAAARASSFDYVPSAEPGGELAGSGNPVTYHGGSVMTSSPVNIYYIFYGSYTSFSPEIPILTDLAGNLAGSSYYHTLTSYQYLSSGQGPGPTDAVAFVNDTLVPTNASRYGSTLNDSGVQLIVSDVINTGTFPLDSNGVYFVFSSSDVPNGTDPTGASFCNPWCAYHNHFSLSSADIKYSHVPEVVSGCCSGPNPSPNNNTGADTMADFFAHELAEAVTDPTGGGGWWDNSNLNEIGDQCAPFFGNTYLMPNGSSANVGIGPRSYLLQELWTADGTGACVLGDDHISNTMGWFFGHFDHSDSKYSLTQVWNNNGALAISTLKPNNFGFHYVFNNYNTGAGAGAVTFLAGDWNGDGLLDIFQPWNNNGALGLEVWQANTTGYTNVWGSNNMGEGPNALQYLVGDFNGDGHSDIMQMWANGTRLGMIVYEATPAFATPTGYSVIWSSSDVGAGTTTFPFIASNVDNDPHHTTDITQIWNNAGNVGLILYTSSQTSYTKIWSNNAAYGNISSSLAWLPGDFDGDGHADLLQIQSAANGTTNFITYTGYASGYNPGVLSTSTTSSSALAWLPGDIDGDGKTDIVQVINSAGTVRTNVWLANGTTYRQLGQSFAEGSGAINWALADVNGDGKLDLVEQYNQGNGSLRAIGYFNSGNWAQNGTGFTIGFNE